MEKSYVAKNKYGYCVLGLVVNDGLRVCQVYPPSTMPIGKHTKKSKKAIKDMVEKYRDMGYTILNPLGANI